MRAAQAADALSVAFQVGWPLRAEGSSEGIFEMKMNLAPHKPDEGAGGFSGEAATWAEAAAGPSRVPWMGCGGRLS